MARGARDSITASLRPIAGGKSFRSCFQHLKVNEADYAAAIEREY